ncbi:YadA-like family protein [Haemophilus parainfluenzae]|uniref:YadA-like family protein n=3 Tax=Haemophilus TaxID=724 RepID=A0AB37IEH8_HAEPA|nr:YadA-like family protein [Haemophilus parainfluenzae]RDE90171.1 hypothetical protein DPV97_09080 [Haemophilus parainfluenzae]RDF05416.1 hypothetical protein DPV91_08635 [Haemophilus parainfluenzae]
MNKIFRIVWSQATQSWVAVSELTKAHKKQSSSNSLKAVVGTAAVLLSINTAQAAVAIGETTANNTFTQSSAQATGDNAVAIGKGSKATAVSAVALGEAANANQARAIAIGKGATIIGDKAQDTIAIGTDTKVQGHNSIVIGKNAKITDGTAEGTLVIGRDAFSEGSGNGVRPNTVVGRGAYTAFGENGTYRLNAATALGLQAGAGVIVDPDNNRKLVRNNTNADDNANVLVKAGFGLDANAPAETKAALQGGNVNNNLTFYRKNHINEATAIGVEARAIGDQSIAIGGQVVAGDGVVALGGNDTDQLRGNKYQVVTDDAVRSTNVSTIDDYNLAYTESTNTVAGQYNKLVGRDMPTGYRSTYGQSGSVVIGMEAHSTTALGTAIGTNSVVRMGAFGATAIGAGSTVQANAEAAVAIGMGSVANGAYALAGGTASWAEYGDVALGYQAKATGKDGAIAMGRATNAQGDSSIMIGGANIASAAAQNTSFEKDSNQVVKKTVTEKINGKDVRREYSFAGTTPTTGTVADAYKELTGLTMDTAALDFAKNKNGHASTSLGVHALSKGDLGTAIGAGSRSDAIGSVALGTGAHATKQNAVAIGTGSTTDLVGTRQLSISYDKDGNIVDDNSPTKAYTFNWAGGTHTAEGDVVSFGSSGAERQLKNVAAGRVAEDSTDAINGSQLNSISKKVALGWNIAGDPKTKVSGIGADDQVNFVNGNGTTVTVTKQEEVKNGDTVTTAKGANVKFDVKAADNTITVTNDGVKVNTGNISTAAVPTVTAGNENKIATVGNVADAIKAAAWKATSAATTNGENSGKKDQEVKAGDTVTFEADKNIKIAQNGSKFTFSTKDNVEFTTVQVGGDQGPKLSKTDDGDLKVSGPNGTDPVKVTNVKDGDISADSKDAINGSQFHKLANNTIQLKGQTGTNAATETDKQALNKENGIAFTVKSSDGNLLEVSAAGDTITLTPKTGTITTGTNGVPTADTTGGKLVTADQLVNALTSMGWKATAGKDGTGTVEDNAEELIKAGETVTFKAGNNLAIKQAGKEFIYSLQKELTGLTSAEFKNQAGDKTVINGDGMTITPKDAPANPVSLTKDGLDNGGKTIKNVTSGLTNYPTGTPKEGLVDLSKPATGTPAVPDTTAATVGDLRNMGWVVSSDKTTGDLTKAYTDQVKNADEVKFVGEGGVTVSGKTENGIRTITVKAEAQEMPEQPVSYTTADGTKVYPVKDKNGNVTYHTTPDGKGQGDKEIPKGDVITSINGPEGTTAPTTLKNVKNNIPAVNDADKKVTNPDGTEKGTTGDVNNINKAPLTAKEAADLLNPTKDGKPNPNFVGNNAATVSDVLNAGWNLQGNGSAVDFVKPFDTVNFVNGKGTKAVVETADNLTSTVKFDVDAGEITADTTKPGAVKGPVTADEAKKLADDLANAQKAVNNLAPDADDATKKAAQDALKAAQDAAAPLNKVATAQNVADMINNSGFTLKADKVDGGENTTVGDNANKEKLTEKGELIKPGSTVTMKAGKNMTVKHEANGNITYATKDDVEFNTVTVGKPAEVYTKKDGKPLTKTKDGKYTDSDGNEVPEKDVVTSNVSPVKLATEKAIPADNNQDGKAPTTALNVTSTDGKPTQITGVGSVLSNESVPTNTNGTPTAQDKQPKLVNLGTKPDENGKVTPLPDNVLNSAATVRDLANMGWIVGAPENGYVDTVKNANQVDFIGKGISVTGKTNGKGIREITISVKDGEVVKPNEFTAKVNGKDTPVIKVGDQYYNTADIDPKTGKPKADPKANVTPVTPDEGTTPTNAGDGYVTGNKVATAIQKSGFVVGKQTEKLSAADFDDKDEKVNPDDELRFADGNNTKVKLATKESVDKDGNKVTTTTVKVDVTGLPVQYTDKNGTPVTKVGDKYFTVDDKGNPTATEVKPADLTTNMVNPAAAPNEIGAPTTLGNVKSNLPSVNDADKNAKDVAGNPIAGKDNKSAPIDAAKAADIAKNAGNNAATVSDVLNAGWNLQNNGEAKDFVKPYDTVNFVDGKGTKVSVETENGTTSNVKFDIDTGKITNNADGSVQGPVTPEMQKALEDATNALNSLPPTAPAAVIDAAKKAVADAANNIANVANKVATAQDVANAINKSGFTLTTSANGGEKISGKPEMINPGKKVEMVAGKNMTVKQESNGKVTYATASNVTFDSVQFGDKGPKITNKAGNINVSGPDGKTPTKITGVAPGEISATSKDAINGSQLHAVASNLNNKINKVGKHADAGTASALAAANIPQAYTPGKSLVGIAAGNYQGQNGLAVGMSRISDNGKIIIRLSGTANTQGKTGVAAGVGYQW